MDGDRDFRFSPRPNRAASIEWRPWTETAFSEARRLGRPVLLSLSAVWCHWCHVMDETSYSDPRIIAAINDHFVAVRVDSDRHPDVNRRYNQGGWPTTAFLAANGDLITGATYLPPDQMLESLARVKAFFDANRIALLALDTTRQTHAADSVAALSQSGGVPLGHDPLPDDFEGDPDVPGDVPAEIALQVVRAFDQEYGGLGTEPKFPQPDVMAFMLAYALLRGGGDPGRVAPGSSALLRPARIHEVVRSTLERMASGGLRDHVGGGFFRYATRRDWSVPHWEKLLADNASLVFLYLDAAIAAAGRPLGDPALYTAAAGQAVDYMLASLWQADTAGFGGSQDADELYYRHDAAGRTQLAEPFVDPTIYVDGNALAARALLRAAPILERSELGDRAIGLLSHLLAKARGSEPMPHYLLPDGSVADGAPLLADQVGMAAALLDAYEVTGSRHWLSGAQAIAGWAREHLKAPDGRLYDRLAEPGASPGLLARPLPALEENALAADVLLRLEAYTGTARYREQALEILSAWAPHYERYGVAGAVYGQTLLRYLDRPDHIVVVGGRDNDAAQRLHARALTAPRPLRTVQWLDPADPADSRRLHETGLAEAVGLTAAAGADDTLLPAGFVCGHERCARLDL